MLAAVLKGDWRSEWWSGEGSRGLDQIVKSSQPPTTLSAADWSKLSDTVFFFWMHPENNTVLYERINFFFAFCDNLIKSPVDMPF